MLDGVVIGFRCQDFKFRSSYCAALGIAIKKLFKNCLDPPQPPLKRGEN
jgi:hypothetical protein